uniref:Voltage-gated hydrogen channel 1 n=1 Tax=Plectus sambesii TaxID=2011161 RepID=A0A914WIU2_9BILA
MTGHVYKKKRPPDGEPTEEERVIMHEGDASSSSGTSDVDRTSESNTPPRFLSPTGRLRQRVDLALHSTKAQVFIVSLVVCNCLVAIVGLLIDLRIFELSGEHDQVVSRVFSYANVAFLGLFVCEMVFKVSVWGMRFFKHRMELFDAVVVLLALALALANFGREPAFEGAALLIMLRLWRVTKILNSMSPLLILTLL